MSQHVDERIVQMHFDNAQFEKGVSQTTQSLENLKKSLNLENSASTAAKEIDKLSKTDMSKLSKNMDVVAKRMSGFGIITAQIWERLGNNIINFGERVYNNTIGQIKAGGRARAQNIANAKFQLKGLGIAWEQVYDDIDYAVANTAYGLDAAANACAQLSASGVQAGDDMAHALRAISGVAAMTNSSYEEIAPIFTTVAGQGKVMTMQLRQLEARGLNAASVLAKSFGTTEEALREMVTKGQVSFDAFSEAMHEAFGEHAVAANETYTGSLANMKAALSRVGEKIAAPWMEGMVPIFNNLRLIINNINKTLDPLIKRVAEGLSFIQAGIGHYLEKIKDATDPDKHGLDGLVDSVGKAMDKIGEWGISVATFIGHVRQFFEYLNGIEDPAKKIEVCLRMLAAGFVKLGWGVVQLAGSGLRTVINGLVNFGIAVVNIFKGNKFVQAGMDAVSGIVTGIASKISELFGWGFRMGAEVLRGLAERVGWHSPWDETVRAMQDGAEGLRVGAIENSQAATEAGEILAERVMNPLESIASSGIGQIGGALAKMVGNVASSINIKTDYSKFTGSLKSLNTTTTESVDVFTKIGASVLKGLESLGKGIGNFISNLTPASASLLVFSTGMVVIFSKISNAFLSFGHSIALLTKGIAGITNNISNILGSFNNMIRRLTGSFKKLLNSMSFLISAQATSIVIQAFASAITKLVIAIAALTFLDQDRLWSATKAVLAITVALGVVAAAIQYFSSKSGPKVQLDILGLAASLFVMTVGISMLVNAFVKLNDVTLDWAILGKLALVLGAISIIALIVWKVEKSAHASEFNMSVLAIFALSLALKVLASALNQISKIETNNLFNTLLMFAAVIGGVVLVMHALSHISLKGGVGAAIAMIAFVLTLLGLAGAIAIFGHMDPKTINQAMSNLELMSSLLLAFAAVGVLMSGISIGNFVSIGGGGAGGGIAILLMTLALYLFPGIINGLANLDPQNITKAKAILFDVAALFLVFGFASKIASEAAHKFGIAVLTAAAGLAIISLTIRYVLNDMELSQLLTGMLVAVGVITALGIALRGAADVFSDAMKPIIAIGIVVAALGVIMALMSGIDPERLIMPLLSIVGVLMTMGYVFSQLKSFDEEGDTKPLYVMLGMLLLIFGGFATLAYMAPDPVLIATIGAAIAGVMWVITQCVKTLEETKMKQSGKDILKTLGFLLGIFALIGTVITAILYINKEASAEQLAAAGISIGIVLTAIANFSKNFKQIKFQGDIKSVGINILETMVLIFGVLLSAGLAIRMLGGIPESQIVAGGIAMSMILWAIGQFSKNYKQFFLNGDVGSKEGLLNIGKDFGQMITNLIFILGVLSSAAGAISKVASSGDPASIIIGSLSISILLEAIAKFSNKFKEVKLEGNWSEFGKQIAFFASMLVVAGLAIALMAGVGATAGALNVIAGSIALGILINAMAATTLILDKANMDGSKFKELQSSLEYFAGLMLIASFAMAALVGFSAWLGQSSWESYIPAAIAMGLLISALAGVMWVFGTLPDSDPEKIKGFAKDMLILSASLLVMTPSLLVLSMVPWEQMLAISFGLAAIIGALGFVAVKASEHEADIKKGAAAIAMEAAALLAISVPIGLLMLIAPIGDMGAGLMSIVEIALGLAAIGFVFKTVGKYAEDVYNGSKAMLAATIALIPLVGAVALLTLVQTPPQDTFFHLAAMAAGMFAFALIAKGLGSMSPDEIRQGMIAMTVMAADMVVIAAAISLVAFATGGDLVTTISSMGAIALGLLAVGGTVALLGMLNGQVQPGLAAAWQIAIQMVVIAAAIGLVALATHGDVGTAIGAALAIAGGLLAVGLIVMIAGAGPMPGFLAAGAGALMLMCIMLSMMVPSLMTLATIADLGLAIGAIAAALGTLIGLGIVAGAVSPLLAAAGWGLGSMVQGLVPMAPVFAILANVPDPVDISHKITDACWNFVNSFAAMSGGIGAGIATVKYLAVIFRILSTDFVPAMVALALINPQATAGSLLTLAIGLRAICDAVEGKDPGKALQGAAKAINDFVMTLSSIPNEVFTKINKLIILMPQLGKFTVQGFSLGVTSNLAIVAYAAELMGVTFDEAFRNYMGIHSASRRAAGWIDWTAEGIGMGALASKPKVEQAGFDIASFLEDGFSNFDLQGTLGNVVGSAVPAGIMDGLHTGDIGGMIEGFISSQIPTDLNFTTDTWITNYIHTNNVMLDADEEAQYMAAKEMGWMFDENNAYYQSLDKEAQKEFKKKNLNNWLLKEKKRLKQMSDIAASNASLKKSKEELQKKLYDLENPKSTVIGLGGKASDVNRDAIQRTKTSLAIVEGNLKASDALVEAALKKYENPSNKARALEAMNRGFGPETLATLAGSWEKQYNKNLLKNKEIVEKNIASMTEAQKKLTNNPDLMDILNGNIPSGGGGGGGGSSKADEAMKKLEELNEAIDGMGPDLMDMTDAFYDKYGAMLVAIGDPAPYDTASKMLMAFGETLVDVGDLSEATEEEILEKSKEIMEALVEKYQGYKDVIGAMFKDGNFFKEFEAKTELQADEIIKNMKDRLNATKTWVANLATLHSKGISNELYEELIQMGVEGGYETVNAFMQMSTEELKNVDAMMTEAKNLEDSLAAQLLVGAADSAMKFTEGISNGIITNQTIALTAAGQMGANIVTQMKMEALLASTEETPDMIAQFTQMLQDGMLDAANLHKLLDTIDQMIAESTDHATGNSKNKKNVEGVGKFMDEGIATGISSQAKEMPLQAMRDLVLELIAVAESTAQVESPSKWGIWFGHMIDYGIANGITEAQTAPIGAGQAMVNRLKNDLSGISAIISSDLTPTITPYLDLSMLEQGASAINGFFGGGVGLRSNLGSYISAQQAQMAAMAASSGRGDSYNITINSPTTDARTLAREVEKAIIRR